MNSLISWKCPILLSIVNINFPNSSIDLKLEFSQCWSLACTSKFFPINKEILRFLHVAIHEKDKRWGFFEYNKPMLHFHISLDSLKSLKPHWFHILLAGTVCLKRRERPNLWLNCQFSWKKMFILNNNFLSV